MKKVLLLCVLSLLTLGGCTSQESPSPAVSQTPDVSELPVVTVPATPTPTPSLSPTPAVSESIPLSTVSEPLPSESSPQPVEETPVVQAPEEDSWNGDPDALSLSDFPTQLSSGEQVQSAVSSLTEGQTLLLLISQLPEHDTWLYGVYGADGSQELILRIGPQWKAFSAPSLTAQCQMPAMLYGDFDKDGAQELAIASQRESGSDTNIWGLYVADFEGDSWSILEFFPADYEAILALSVSCTYDAQANTAVLQAGADSVTLDLSGLGLEAGASVTSSVGGLVLFTAEEDTLYGTFSIRLTSSPSAESSEADNAALAQAEVVYTGSAFGLNDLSLLPAGSEP